MPLKTVLNLDKFSNYFKYKVLLDLFLMRLSCIFMDFMSLSSNIIMNLTILLSFIINFEFSLLLSVILLKNKFHISRFGEE